MSGKKAGQHHCPQCKAVNKVSCVTKGHMVECPRHGATNALYGQCHQCHGEAKRKLNGQWKNGEKRREEELKRTKREEEEQKIREKNDRKMAKYDKRQRSKSSSSNHSPPAPPAPPAHPARPAPPANSCYCCASGSCRFSKA